MLGRVPMQKPGLQFHLCHILCLVTDFKTQFRYSQYQQHDILIWPVYQRAESQLNNDRFNRSTKLCEGTYERMNEIKQGHK